MSDQPAPPPEPRAAVPMFTASFERQFMRVWLVLWGIVAPAGFLLAATGYKLDFYSWWQSGSSAVYAVLMHHWPNASLIHALLLPSAYALWRVVRFPDRTQPAWVAGLLLAGAILWAQLLVAWVIGTQGIGAVAGFVGLFVGPIYVCGLIGIGYGIASLPKLLSTREMAIAAGFATLTVGVPLLFLTPDAGDDVWEVLLGLGFFIGFAAAFFATPVAFATYAWAAWRCFAAPRPTKRISLATLMLALTWLSANFAAWAFAFRMAIRDYAALPPTQPEYDCFVVTAAARGHRRVVGSNAAGVNRQLRTLKGAELLLRHLSPRLHARLRRAYNWVGPCVARRIRGRWLADCVFLLLKPLEWFGEAALWAARVPRAEIDRLYSGRRPPEG